MSGLLQMTHRLLQSKGVDDFILKSTSTSGLVDSNFPTKGSTKTYTSHTLWAFPGSYTQRQIAFGVVKKGDIKLYVSPIDPDGRSLTVVPKADDLITHPNLGTLRVKDVIIHSEGETDVLYILQVRK